MDTRNLFMIIYFNPLFCWDNIAANVTLMYFCAVQVLCLSPTFELAIQIGEVASKMSQFDPDIKIR
jgi:hypothetical protein